jgi:hypothetical protein
MGTKDSGYIEIKEKKHIQRVSQDEFEHGDPNFIDERTHKDAKEEKQSFCNRIFGK